MNKYIEKLHWDCPSQELDKIINEINNDSHFNYRTLILPKEGKMYWENCARVLINLNDEQIIKLLPDILEWFQDLNWPGGILILERLQLLSANVIEEPVITTIENAEIQNDYSWVEFLLYLNNIKTVKIVNKILEYIKRLNKEYAMVIIEWFKELPPELKNEEVMYWVNKH